MAIGYNGSLPSSTLFTPAPGPVISYAAAGTNSTLIIAGQIASAGALSTTSGLTAVTDTSGNTWHFSTSDTQALTGKGTPVPPMAYNATGWVVFIAWCAGIYPGPGSVQLSDATGDADVWRVQLLEMTGVLAPTASAAVTGIFDQPTAHVNLGNAGDLTVGICYTNANFTSTPAGFTNTYLGAGTFCSVIYDLTGAGGGHATWVADASDQYALAMMSFAAVPALPPPQPVPVMRSV